MPTQGEKMWSVSGTGLSGKSETRRRSLLVAIVVAMAGGLLVASVAAPPSGAQAAGTGGIGDRVWNDANGNGIQDAGEGGVAGVVVRVHSTGGALLGQAVSDATGRFLVGGLAPDLVTVSVDLASLPAQSGIAPQSQTGWTLDSDFSPTSGTTRSYANAGGNLNVDLGLVGVAVGPSTTPTTVAPTTLRPTTIALTTTTTATPITTTTTTLAPPVGISGTVWNDANANGRREANEARASGTVLGLHRVVGGTWSWYSSGLTNASGSYAFIGLPTGSYAVVIDRGAARSFSAPNVGSDDLDSDVNDLGYVVVAASSGAATVVDAGLLVGPAPTSTTAPGTTAPPLSPQPRFGRPTAPTTTATTTTTTTTTVVQRVPANPRDAAWRLDHCVAGLLSRVLVSVAS